MYIGPAEALVSRLLAKTDDSATRIRSFQHGDIAALKAMAERLNIVGIINRHVPSSRKNISIGLALLLSAINRVSAPCSKSGWTSWAEQTSVEHLFNVDPKKFTSQFFWDCMDDVSISALEAIEDDLTQCIVQTFNIKLDLLFYDPTNFFTFISSDNERSTLTKRGKNKQKRFDLRQFSLALLASRDSKIPLCSHVYEGNKPDSKVFPETLTMMRRRLERLVGKLEDLTIVYDKGNNSKANQALVDAAPFHYVGALVLSQHQDLLSIPESEYETLESGNLAGVHAHRLKRMVWGAERTLVLFISENFRSKQVRGFQQHLNKALEYLKTWKAALAKPGSGPLSAENAEKQIDQILAQQHVKDVVQVEYNKRRKGSDRLSFNIDQDAINHLYNDVFGKRLLMTNRHEWSSEEIINAYNAQSNNIEANFAQLKDPDHLAVRPQYHWTDQKIRVHTFICLLGLLLSRLVEKVAKEKAGYTGSLDGLLDRLSTIRLAMTLTAGVRGRPKCAWQLEDADPQALAIFRALVPN